MNNEPNNTFNSAAPQPAPQPDPTPTPEPAAPAPEPTTPEPAAPAETPVIPAAQPKPKTGGKKKLLPIIIIALVVIGLIIAAIILLPKIFGNKTDEELSLEESITQSNSFFIYDRDKDLYALFDIEGNQLTEFNISRHDEFANGATRVENTDKNYGIMGTDGKMIVDYGTCKYLYQRGSLYACTDEDYNESLLDASGNTILKAKDLDVESYVGEYLFTLVQQEDEEGNETYTVYNYKGDAMTSFPVAEDSDVKSPMGNSKENYVALYYNGTQYIFDIPKSKLLLSFSDTEGYCVHSVNEANANEFTIQTCSTWYSSTEKDEQKLIRDGKIVFSKGGEDLSSLYFDGEALIYHNGIKNYLVDSEGNQVAEINRIQYKDSKNYIIMPDEHGSTADLYVNGEKKQQVSCYVSYNAKGNKGIYVLYDCKDFDKGDHIFMKYDGTVINKASYKDINEFDKNGYAVVSEDGKEYYLIDTNGDTVSAKYAGDSSSKISKVSGTKDVYIGSNADGTETVFKVKGDAIATAEDIITNFSDAKRANTCVAAKKGETYTVYNVTTSKELVTLDSKPDLNDMYFTTTKNDKTQYYSCVNGKMFYEGVK